MCDALAATRDSTTGVRGRVEAVQVVSADRHRPQRRRRALGLQTDNSAAEHLVCEPTSWLTLRASLRRLSARRCDAEEERPSGQGLTEELDELVGHVELAGEFHAALRGAFRKLPVAAH